MAGRNEQVRGGFQLLKTAKTSSGLSNRSSITRQIGAIHQTQSTFKTKTGGCSNKKTQAILRNPRHITFFNQNKYHNLSYNQFTSDLLRHPKRENLVIVNTKTKSDIMRVQTYPFTQNSPTRVRFPNHNSGEGAWPTTSPLFQKGTRHIQLGGSFLLNAIQTTLLQQENPSSRPKEKNTNHLNGFNF